MIIIWSDRNMFKVEIKTGFEYDCYGFVASGDGKVYGVCYHKGDSGFMLIPYNTIKPIDDKTLNENKMNEAIQSRSKFLK